MLSVKKLIEKDISSMIHLLDTSQLWALCGDSLSENVVDWKDRLQVTCCHCLEAMVDFDPDYLENVNE